MFPRKFRCATLMTTLTNRHIVGTALFTEGLDTTLLQLPPALRNTETYNYDLVDVARQVLANESHAMLPQIKAAYDAHDRATFVALTQHWLQRMQLLNNLLATN
jgi:hypothetical protein